MRDRPGSETAGRRDHEIMRHAGWYRGNDVSINHVERKAGV
jgi:hypothetical protein